MGKLFFVGWALWEKMTFVLACAIVLTIAIGYCKVLHTHRKLKKFASQPAGARAVQEPQMVEAAVLPKSLDKVEVPFGIRAIQSGIEIDGIWISGANTPVPSSPATSTRSKPDASGSSSRPVSALEVPQTSIGPSSRPTSRGPLSSFDRAVSAERITNHSRDSSPVSIVSVPRARQHRPPPTAYARYSTVSVLRNSATIDTLEGQDDDEVQSMTERPSSGDSKTYNPGSETSRKSGGSSNNPADHASSDDDNDHMDPTQAPLMAPPRPRDYRTDLRLLQTHRMSHVAETGSLARRERPLERHAGRSVDWSSISLDIPVNRSAPTSGPPSPPSPPPSPPTPPSAHGTNPFIAPMETIGSPTRDSHPENAAIQAVPLLETYQPSGPNFNDDAPRPVSFHNQRDTQVLRKVNSGFEILRPGTFSVGPPQSDASTDNDRGQHKKLQKKRRPSTDSHVSSFVEQA